MSLFFKKGNETIVDNLSKKLGNYSKKIILKSWKKIKNLLFYQI